MLSHDFFIVMRIEHVMKMRFINATFFYRCRHYMILSNKFSDYTNFNFKRQQDIWNTENLSNFKPQLKTHPFDIAFRVLRYYKMKLCIIIINEFLSLLHTFKMYSHFYSSK